MCAREQETGDSNYKVKQRIDARRNKNNEAIEIGR